MKCHAINIWKRWKTTRNPICGDTRFKNVPVVKAGRVVSRYSGVLPQVPAFRHLLLVAHLRILPGEGLEPYRVDPNNTHELWIWYQHRPIGAKKLLFRCQFDAGSYLIERAKISPDYKRFAAIKIAEHQSDKCAKFVAQVIADLLEDSTEYGATLASKDGDWYWSLAVERAIHRCDNLPDSQ